MTPARALGALALGAALWAATLGRGAAAEAAGDAARGQHVFASRQCARCHLPRGQRGMGPALEVVRRSQGAYELTGRLWNHAPAMFTALKQEGVEWPQIGAAEMADLMAFLGADPKRDPWADLSRGQVVLVSKGCLKCHSFRREGGRVGPDLAERRAALVPPAAWGATVWAHTPRMAAAAIRLGVLYPRFSGDEMVHLVGFLRSGP